MLFFKQFFNVILQLMKKEQWKKLETFWCSWIVMYVNNNKKPRINSYTCSVVLVVAFIQSSDLGGRDREGDLLPGNQRLSSGAPSLRSELRLAGGNRPTHQSRILPQLLSEPGTENTQLGHWSFFCSVF